MTHNLNPRLVALVRDWCPPPRKSFSDPEMAAAAIFGSDPALAAAAADIRRAGLPVLTLWTGKRAQQLKKAVAARCEVAVFPGPSGTYVVKDLWTRRQKEVAAKSILDEVAEVLENGYYDPDEAFEDFMDRKVDEWQAEKDQAA